MNLIDKIKKLGEREQRAREYFEIASPIDYSDYLEQLVDDAPAMREVLGMIREGDAERLERAAERLRMEAIGWREEDYLAAKEDIAAYRRLQQMAAMMEKEGREG